MLNPQSGPPLEAVQQQQHHSFASHAYLASTTFLQDGGKLEALMLNNKTKNNCSVLVLAVSGSASNVVKNSLDLGADVNMQLINEWYCSALAVADSV
jgi:hypothetical protein